MLRNLHGFYGYPLKKCIGENTIIPFKMERGSNIFSRFLKVTQLVAARVDSHPDSCCSPPAASTLAAAGSSPASSKSHRSNQKTLVLTATLCCCSIQYLCLKLKCWILSLTMHIITKKKESNIPSHPTSHTVSYDSGKELFTCGRIFKEKIQLTTKLR